MEQVELGSRCVRDAAVYRGQVVFVTDAGEVFTRDLAGGEVRPLPILEPKKTCTHGQEEKGRKVRVRAVAAGADHILFLSAQDEIWVQGCGPALGELALLEILFYFCWKAIPKIQVEINVSI